MIDDILSESGCDYFNLANLPHLISDLEGSRIVVIWLGLGRGLRSTFR